ncbi:MarR family winged helix-turn-helix transcriptional regulator [Hymenobacter nivis]|uniref:MarR family transcriptional regulator n=1 Tax=Hymenobacter nivis TaxID=1850093 RepID=A0A502GU12_9BACT|nr:MarR family transcriptional regulator [Hymenobacter nivis]TPG65354.1 MarR family transcriptional regulator [Hymenobacter nivis]
MPVDVQALAQLFARAPFSHPTEASGFLLWRVAHRYQRDIDRACAAVDLTHLQFITLLLSGWLGRAGAIVSQVELAATSGIHPMQLSQVLKALEQKALVERPRNPADSRRKQVQLTAAGVHALTQAIPLAEAAQRQFFEGVADQPQLHPLLLQVVSSWPDEV